MNRVMMIGHLAADVELRQTKTGNPLATFPVATNRFAKDKDGEKKEVVDYHRLVAFGKLAGICEKFLCKGTAVFISGNLVNRSYVSKGGETHYRSEIILDELNILTWKKNKSGDQEVKIEAISEESEKVKK